jgi:hypothetical protein
MVRYFLFAQGTSRRILFRRDDRHVFARWSPEDRTWIDSPGLADYLEAGDTSVDEIDSATAELLLDAPPEAFRTDAPVRLDGPGSEAPYGTSGRSVRR